MSDPHARLSPTTTKGKEMIHLSIPVSLMENEDRIVCVFCDNETTNPYCSQCMDYKGLMTIPAWEDYTGEKWEDQK